MEGNDRPGLSLWAASRGPEQRPQGRPSGGATRLVDLLEEMGYIERVACPSDRQVQWVRLTDSGLEVLVAATEVHLRDLDEHFSGHLTTNEMATLADLLDRIRIGSDAG